jgi:hypothetical protein
MKTPGQRWIWILAGAVLAACEPASERCDHDQRYSHGLCFQADAGTVAPDASFVHYADVCSDATGCAAPTDFCLRQPADPTGYCTRTGCLAEPGRCPSGWTCTDLSVYLAGLPAVCTQP